MAKNQTTQTSSSEPWGPSQPPLQTGIADAQNLYNSGVGGAIDRTSHVIPFSQQSMFAMNNAQNAAQANMGPNGLGGQYQNAINSGGLNPWQQQAVGGMRSTIASGGYNPAQQQAMGGMRGTIASGGLDAAQRQAMSGMRNTIASGGYNPAQQQAMSGYRSTIASGGLDQTQRNQMAGLNSVIGAGGYNADQRNALAGVRQTANGAFNPYQNSGFGSVLRQAQDSARDNVNAGAAAAGRYGSAVHQGNVANEIGNVTGGLLNNEYNNWQDRRTGAQNTMFGMGQQGQANQNAARGDIFNMAQQGQGNLSNAQNSLFGAGQQGQANLSDAQNSLFGMGQQGQGNLSNAFNSLFGMGQQGQGNLSSAQGNLFNMGQQGFNNIGAAYQGMQAPWQTMAGIGSQYEDLGTRQMNDRNRIFDSMNSMPWEQLARLNGIASGVGSLGGSQSGTATQPSNLFGQIGGGLLGLSGLFGG